MNKVLIFCLLSILINVIFSDICSSKDDDGDITDSDCRLLDIETGSPKEDYICIKGDEGCEEKQLCLKVVSGDCTTFPAKSDENRCIQRANKGAEDPFCEETLYQCGQQPAGKASATYCPKLKTTDLTKKVCVKKEGNNDQCIEIANCNEAKIGATDEICEKLVVSDGKKCIKEGDACVEKTLCDGAEGESDEVCKTFYVSDSTKKKCVKKKGENKCESVDKSENNSDNGTKGMKLPIIILMCWLYL